MHNNMDLIHNINNQLFQPQPDWLVTLSHPWLGQAEAQNEHTLIQTNGTFLYIRVQHHTNAGHEGQVDSDLARHPRLSQTQALQKGTG